MVARGFLAIVDEQLIIWERLRFKFPSAQRPGNRTASIFSELMERRISIRRICALESIPATVWVASSAMLPPQITRRTNGGRTSSAALPAMRWLRTTPIPMATQLSKLAGIAVWLGQIPDLMRAIQISISKRESLRKRSPWRRLELAGPRQARRMVLESIPALGGKNWTAINTNSGDGNNYQLLITNYTGNASFLPNPSPAMTKHIIIIYSANCETKWLPYHGYNGANADGDNSGPVPICQHAYFHRLAGAEQRHHRSERHCLPDGFREQPRCQEYVPSSGTVTTLAGQDGPEFARDIKQWRRSGCAIFQNPLGIVYARGRLVVVDSGNQTLRFVTTRRGG